ncbi:MAG: prephenate dehydrogenase/arogenate dehydrogenase family protein [Bacteroidota bacterium]
MTVGLLGYGRFGKLAARYISQHADVVAYDPLHPPGSRGRRHTRFVSLAEAASQRVLVLAVPVSVLEDVLRKSRPHVRPGALVIDVCAVKSQPARWMKALLPRSVHILGTHPLLGPDSASRTLSGKTVILCPVRIPAPLLSRVKRILRRKGLITTVMSVGEHDRMAAETIFLTQYLGRMVGKAGLRRWPNVTFNYRNLLTLTDVAERDSFTLLADMARYSSRGERVVRALKRAQQDLDQKLHSSRPRRRGRQ